MSALLDLEDLVADMGDTTRILMHLAYSRDVQMISAAEWGKLGRDLHNGLCTIKELAAAAVEENRAEITAHREALDAVRAEKAGTGSAEEREQVEALWTLLRGAVTMAAGQCHKAGYPLPGWRRKSEEAP
jgi:hypothetical protein